LSNLYQVSRWGVVPLGAGPKIAVWNLLNHIWQGAFRVAMDALVEGRLEGDVAPFVLAVI